MADVLEALVDVNLLESPAPDQYRFHDLLKVYAMERAQSEESDDARDEAVNRLLWWYLDSARAAADRVSPQRYQIPREPEAAGHPALAFGTVDAALAWYDDERANVVAATRQAAGAGLQEVAWRLPPTLFPLFNRRSNWADCVTTHRVAADSAKKAGDRLGEAWALNQLGFALVRLQRSGGVRLSRAGTGDQAASSATREARRRPPSRSGEGYLRMRGAGEDALRYLQHAAELLEPMGATSQRSVALEQPRRGLLRPWRS